jgi:hypothetical protein
VAVAGAILILSVYSEYSTLDPRMY